jgi:hypothetical protein
MLLSIWIIGCAKPKEEMPDLMTKAPVQIEFGHIPKKPIVDDTINAIQEIQIRSKIVEKYPGIQNLNLLHFKKICGKVDYYEYCAAMGHDSVDVFGFIYKGETVIKGFKCKYRFDKDERIELEDEGVKIYKRFASSKSTRTTAIYFNFEKMAVWFYLDDGFTKW